MAEGLRLTGAALLAGVGLSATFLALLALFPAVLARSRRAADQSPGRSFLLGLVNAFFLSAVGFGFSALAEGIGWQVLQLPAVLAFSLLTILLVFGLAAVAGLIGERLFPDSSMVGRQLRGSIVLILASLTPFLGWFALFPYAGLVGLGAVILGWSRGQRPVNEGEDLPGDA